MFDKRQKLKWLIGVIEGTADDVTAVTADDVAFRMVAAVVTMVGLEGAEAALDQVADATIILGGECGLSDADAHGLDVALSTLEAQDCNGKAH